MNKHKIEQQITEYIQQEFGVDDEDFSAESDLFEDGYIESVHLEKFFSTIEKRYDVFIDEELFFDDRISTVKGIAQVIIELKGEA